MKNVFSMLMIGLIVTACGHQGSRGIASQGECYLDKHPKAEHYRIYVKGEPYNKYWYEKPVAKKIMSRIPSCK